jgi:hypothetical protein
MADKGDEAAKVARARALREQIRRLVSGDEPQDDASETESPRDFIHKKMRDRDCS